MNAQLQSSFDRVESALDTLVDSITTFNPSIPAAAALLEADDGLTKDLDRLSKHQSNHALLLSLRETSSSFDEQIKSVIRLLADTRKELLDVSKGSAEDETNQTRIVDSHELLEYAQRIAKYSVRPKLKALDAADKGDSTEDKVMTNGTDEDAQAQNLTDGTIAVSRGLDPKLAQAAESRSLAFLTPEAKQWLEPDEYAPKIPFPSDALIRSGALSRIQAQLDEGLDPAGMNLAGNDSNNAVKQEDVGDRLEQNGLMRKQSFAGVSTHTRPTAEEIRAEQKRKEEMFQGFDLYNPDDDE